MPFKDKNREKEHSKKYYEENKEHIREQKRQARLLKGEEINAANREKYKNDPEYRKNIRAQAKEFRLKNKETIRESRRTGIARFSFTKSSAKQRGLNFTLLEDQYITLINSPCHYCDNQLDSPTNSSGIGLDRLDNDRGYEVDNVVPCCVICNRVRNKHFTPEETKIAIQAVVAFRNQDLK